MAYTDLPDFFYGPVWVKKHGSRSRLSSRHFPPGVWTDPCPAAIANQASVVP